MNTYKRIEILQPAGGFPAAVVAEITEPFMRWRPETAARLLGDSINHLIRDRVQIIRDRVQNTRPGPCMLIGAADAEAIQILRDCKRQVAAATLTGSLPHREHVATRCGA